MKIVSYAYFESKYTRYINVIFRPYARVSKCNMSLESSHPKFQTNLGYIQLLKVNIIVDITQRHSITEDRYVFKKKKIPNIHFRLQVF